MAVLTPVDLEEAAALGLSYGKRIASIHGIQGGSVNSNFELRSVEGEKLFLRVYEEQVEATAGREARLLAHLAKAGVVTPEPLMKTVGNGFISTLKGKPAAVFPFLDGEILCQPRLTEVHTRAVGHALGSIHRAGELLSPADLEQIVGQSRFDRASLLGRLDGLDQAMLSEELLDACVFLRSYLSRPPPEVGRVGLIHGDLFRDNVLWQGTEIVALLDFESASLGSLAFDLAVTLLAWCFGDRLEEGLLRAMIEGYGQTMEVDGAFLRELHAEALFAAARFFTTRITDFELRPRGVGVYKDFRRFRARFQAVEALGAGGFERLVAT